ncbi:V-type proton ATPase subunit e [Ceratitis capitata]|uniref:V-type proton ATPase subunit e n=1 Tax=Ceratitis capitata TaxID=7213 RepID=UPI00032A1BDA|nr:V-type proton ATPase subunit e [Ceratitis capitata]
MGAAFFPVLFFTAFWACVGIGVPMMTPKGPHQSLFRCIMMLTAATCWLFWLCCYMAQMNPLLGPKLNQHTIYMIAKEWGNELKDG